MRACGLPRAFRRRSTCSPSGSSWFLSAIGTFAPWLRAALCRLMSTTKRLNKQTFPCICYRIDCNQSNTCCTPSPESALVAESRQRMPRFVAHASTWSSLCDNSCTEIVDGKSALLARIRRAQRLFTDDSAKSELSCSHASSRRSRSLQSMTNKMPRHSRKQRSQSGRMRPTVQTATLHRPTVAISTEYPIVGVGVAWAASPSTMRRTSVDLPAPCNPTIRHGVGQSGPPSQLQKAVSKLPIIDCPVEIKTSAAVCRHVSPLLPAAETEQADWSQTTAKCLALLLAAGATGASLLAAQISDPSEPCFDCGRRVAGRHFLQNKLVVHTQLGSTGCGSNSAVPQLVRHSRIGCPSASGTTLHSM